ncbi:MAG: TAXI family TRAP transporter solute-binding subunit [Verrucomicrobia bacterium]|nr:TAXI family TRAP transporter solute-binding subunit [Verrucomicrobiota bacterium]
MNPQNSAEEESDPTQQSILFHRWIAWGMIGIVILSLTTWYFTREKLPKTISIGTAAEGGLYHRLGGLLAERLQKRVNRPVKPIPSLGSLENLERLAKHEIHFAILQSSLLAFKPVAVLAPLYKEPVHIIVRHGSGIATLQDVKGRRVALGPEGSGMRESARQLLDHFQIPFDSLSDTERYFADLLHDDGPDAAIVTTGIENPDLLRVLASRKFELLPVENADAIAARFPGFAAFEIPRGLYGENPSAPLDNVPTVATTAILTGTLDVSSLLVNATLESIDPDELKEYLDEVTRIKLRALEELTDEDLRGDQFFSIFLTQCANLIRKIQSKLF